MGRPRKEKKSTEDILNEMFPNFTVEARSWDAVTKKAKIVGWQVTKSVAKDEINPKGLLPSSVRDEIIRLTAELKDLKASYKETIEACTQKQQYVIDLLKEAGEYQAESATSGEQNAAVLEASVSINGGRAVTLGTELRAKIENALAEHERNDDEPQETKIVFPRKGQNSDQT